MARRYLWTAVGIAAVAIVMSSAPVFAQRGGGRGGGGGGGGGGGRGGPAGGGGGMGRQPGGGGGGGAWRGGESRGGPSARSGGSGRSWSGGGSFSPGGSGSTVYRGGQFYGPRPSSPSIGRSLDGRYGSGYRGGSYHLDQYRQGHYGDYHDHHHRHYGYSPYYYSPYYSGYGTRIYINPFGYGIGLGLGLTGLYGPYFGGWYGSDYYGYGGLGLYGYSLGRYFPPSYYSSGTYYSGSTVPYTIYDPMPTLPSTDVAPVAPSSADDYLQSARDAFAGGNFAEAQRLANHAVIESPENAKSHELFSLAMFAQGNYREAAAAAHAAAALAPLADWPTLYRYYNDKEKYTAHLRALQKSVKENPAQLDGRFLLGVHYLMLGHQAEARTELRAFLDTVKNDPVGRKLYQDAGGKVEDLPPLETSPLSAPPGSSAPAENPPLEIPPKVPASP